MNGTEDGSVNPAAGLAFIYTLTPTGGTMQFADVGGVLNYSGAPPTGTVILGGTPDPITGSLVGALTP